MGARSFLIAYNLYIQTANEIAGPVACEMINLAASQGEREGKMSQPDITAARAIARELRASNGGLRGVKALGMMG